MKIEPIDNGNLRIWLAEEEIEEWGLNDSRGGGVRRLVRRALSAVGRRLTSRTLAEMIPVEGGCVVLVSTYIPRVALPAVYAADEASLAQIGARWRVPMGENALVYAVDDGYRLVVYSDDRLEEKSDALLREYAQPLGGGEGLAAHVAEYGRLITTLAPVPPTPEDRDR